MDPQEVTTIDTDESRPRDLVLKGVAAIDSFILDVDLVAGPGTTVAVVGPNGAGKTTLLNILAGLSRLRSGHLHVGNQMWDAPGSDTFVPPEGRDIALVPQNALLFPHLSIVDNVSFGLRHRKPQLTRNEQRAQANEALEIADLENLAGRRPGQLSGGQQQRAAIVRALLTRPGLLLMDEPLSNVDAANRQQLRQAIAELRPPGQIQMVVTHGHDHATAADQIIALHHGRIAACGSPAGVAATTTIGWLKDMLSATN